MADATLLRQNQINRNASLGAQPPHGSIKTGELPLVNVKPPPGGPQIQEGQQKPVAIMPSKDPNSVTTTGALPMVMVKMVNGKPQPDNGLDNSAVVIKNNRGTHAAGGLPMVVATMINGKPQVQTQPNVGNAPPQIAAAAPALSAPRGAPTQQRQGYSTPATLNVPRVVHTQIQGVTRTTAPQMGITRVAAPRPALPPIPELTPDQLLLCRHLADKYLADLQALVGAQAADAGEGVVEGTTSENESIIAANMAIAHGLIEQIDQITISIAIRDEAAAKSAAASAAAHAAQAAAPAVIQVAAAPVAHATPASPMARSYVAPRPGGNGIRAQGNAVRGPRRVAPPAKPHPLVEVTMHGNQAIVKQTAPADVAAASVPAEVAAGQAIQGVEHVTAEVVADVPPTPEQQG